MAANKTNEFLSRNGINSMTESDFKYSKDEVTKAVYELMTTIHTRPKFAKEIAIYRKYVPVLLSYVESVDKYNTVLSDTFCRMADDSEEKKHKRWTEEEDNALIELVCSDMSMIEVSTTLGRTVPSIKTRLTKLVGLKRLSQEIAGKFVGEVDGQEVDGYIKGTLHK